jgi:hypothetical protein
MNVLKMNALISFMIIITLLLLSCNGFNDQERAPLRCKIAKELKNTLSLGIEKHKKTFGYYPISDGKYFLDSIEQFIQIDSIISFMTCSIPNKKLLLLYQKEAYGPHYLMDILTRNLL